MMKSIRRRLANFGFLVGGAMLALYFTANSTESQNTNMLLYGILLILFAFTIGKDSKPDPVESSRFRTVRRLRKGEGLFPKATISEEEKINPDS